VTAHRLDRSRYGFGFSADAEPALLIDSGDSVVIETLDCFSNKVDSAEQRFERDADLLSLIGRYNPVTGPIAVRGARPGDRLAVRVDRISLGTHAPFAVTVITGDRKGICGRQSPLLPPVPDTRICPLDGDYVLFPTHRGDLRLPVRPMIGSVGTAPAVGTESSLEFDYRHGGNVDCPDLTVGATLTLPVNVPGGLLWLGDVHAAMGDGEITGTALETNADVTVTVTVLPGSDAVESDPAPWLDDAISVGSIGCEFGADLSDNLHRAFADLLDRLVAGYGLDAVEAYELLGAAGRVTVNQCVLGGWTAARAWIEKRMLPSALPSERAG
jgi:amidase